MENGEEKKENQKRKSGKLKMEGEKLQTEKRTFPPPHFSKPLKFVLGLPKWEFFYRKKAFHLGKKIRKNNFALSEKYFFYALVSLKTVRSIEPTLAKIDCDVHYGFESLVHGTDGLKSAPEGSNSLLIPQPLFECLKGGVKAS